MLRSTVDHNKHNNAGFSIVELVVVVAILAIAAVPLMKSMGMATRTNAKAQSIQNATSLGEKIMEEIKSSSIAEIKAKYGPTGTGQLTENTNDYVINLTGVKATQGETYDVLVKIDKAAYSDNTTPVADKKANVKSANTLLIPRIEDIDTLSQAVLESTKELNKYDTEAQSFFNEKLTTYPTDSATITSKTVNIEKKDITFPTGVKVTATVKYTDDASHEYTREIYTGTFTPIDYVAEGGSTAYKPLDSNIYIFYKKGCISETINITDYSTYTNPEDPSLVRDSHRVYFIRQDTTDSTGPTVVLQRKTPADVLITSHTFKFSDAADSLTDWYDDSGTDMELITNVIAGSEKHIYKEEARNRVYEITVKLSKGGEDITTLTSTVSASDEK